LHGLKLAAVAVVAQAVWSMGRRLCTGRVRTTLALGSAAVLLALPSNGTQLATIAACALAGWALLRTDAPTGTTTESAPSPHPLAYAALLVFVGLLVSLPLARSATGASHVALLDGFYRAGALVFGGGHVVLPLLRNELVPNGWLTDDAFLAGYGAAQAVPGPLFTFAAYLGTVMATHPHRWLSGLFCQVAILLPAWLLVGGALPFWERWRTRRAAQAAMQGAAASVVGVLLAALYVPVFTESVHSARDVVAVLVAFGLLETWSAPPVLVVVAWAVLGAITHA
jgi:chromate transporter